MGLVEVWCIASYACERLEQHRSVCNLTTSVCSSHDDITVFFCVWACWASYVCAFPKWAVLPLLPSGFSHRMLSVPTEAALDLSLEKLVHISQ